MLVSGDLRLLHATRRGAERNHIARKRADRVDRFAGAQTGEIELIDDIGIGIGNEVEDEIIAALEGVDVMKGEYSFGFCRCDPLTAILGDEWNLRPRSGSQR